MLVYRQTVLLRPWEGCEFSDLKWRREIYIGALNTNW